MHDRSKRFSTGRLVQYCKLTKSYQVPVHWAEKGPYLTGVCVNYRIQDRHCVQSTMRWVLLKPKILRSRSWTFPLVLNILFEVRTWLHGVLWLKFEDGFFQPLQFLMTCASVFFEKVTKVVLRSLVRLYVTCKVDLPTEHESEARDLKFISEDGKQIKKFHLWLVKAMMVWSFIKWTLLKKAHQALQLIVPDMSMRENMSYSQIFCWVFLLDEVFAGDLESDWVLRGGSSAFFRCVTLLISNNNCQPKLFFFWCQLGQSET